MAATPIWPVTHDIPDTIKNFICRFYKLADAKEGDGPEQFAALFTEDGIARGLTNTARGTRELIAARVKSWDDYAKRTHTPLKAYTNSPDNKEVLVVGRLDATFKNGKTVQDEFIGRFNFNGDTNNPKVEAYRPFADSAAINKIMQS